MPCTPTVGSISTYHSGGLFNCDPCKDLGGGISTCPITSGLEHLFPTLGPKLSRKGREDYRCFYIKNDSADAWLRNVSIYLGGKTGRETPGKGGGTYVALGVKLEDAVQKVIVTGPYPPNEGEFFELQIPNYDSFKVYFDPNITKWVGNFQSAIRAVNGFPEVVVTVVGTVPIVATDTLNVVFTVNFGGHDSRNAGRKGMDIHARWRQATKHEFETMTVVQNTLTNCVVGVSLISAGSPINTIAGGSSGTSAPAGIPFDYYFKGNPIRLGDFMPGDIMPLWVRRTLPAPTPYAGVLVRSKQTAKLLEEFDVVIEATSP